jgi:2-keto-4-pentenoate hydratase/2-oxohepta-3-ene-1,7-dioic acid hydratase in catechol pathway
MNYVFPPPPPVSVPVAGGNTLFPVRRVYCVGRNYADHAAEMGADGREPPFFFSKPSDALVPGGGMSPIRQPPAIFSTRSNWSLRWPLVAPISIRHRRSTASMATQSVLI